MTRRRRPLAVLTAVVGSLVLLVAACGDDGEDEPDPTTTTAPATTTTTTAPAGGGEAAVRVYFVADEKVATAGATVTPPAVARGALEALLAGPDDLEAGIGQSTAIPEGTRLLGITIDGGRATVDLSGAFDDGGGSLSMQVRAAQVVFTLTQFDTVDTVAFRLDGEPITALGGEGVDVDDVDRSDFASVTPLVLVESPVPGEVVSSPLEISGMANTFEANVQYAVADGSDHVVDQGFTTASAGNGTFGTFSLTSTFTGAAAGNGEVVGFEESAQDGSRVNTYVVPVVFP